MVIYFIKSTICLITLYGFYHFVLRNHKILIFNRFYLLFSLVFSLTVPLIEIPVSSSFTLINSFNELTNPPSYVSEGGQIIENTYISNTNRNILPILIIAFSAILLIRFAYNIFTITRRTIRCKKIEMGNLSLVLVEERTLPYSFFKYIFVNKSDYEDGKIEKELLIHEEAHCLQYHSVDIILIELIKLFFWFNPALWLYRKEILLNHEYSADSKVLENNEATDYYKLLVNLVIQNNTSYLASNFKYSSIKNRLIMMTKDRPTHNAILRKIAAIPLFLIVGMTLTNGQAIKQQDNIIDFSGKWVLNLSESKSFLTEVASTTPLGITISQDKNSVTMDININAGAGNQLSRTEKYIFNESVVRKNTEGDKTSVLTCSAAPDGKSFSITEVYSAVYNGVAGESKRISVYTLSNDGRNLIIEIDDTPRQGSITPENENHETRVFDKTI